MPKTFRDSLTLVVLGLIFVLWLLASSGRFTVPETIIGASIMAFTLVVQFYFRKNGPEPPAP